MRTMKRTIVIISLGLLGAAIPTASLAQGSWTCWQITPGEPLIMCAGGGETFITRFEPSPSCSGK